MGASITVIGPSDAQVEYRLTGQSGCGEDAKLGYYLDAPERPMRWIGRGAAAVGLQEGAVLGQEHHDMARAIMRGMHPTTGERLVVPTTRVAPAAMLPAAPLHDALLLEAARRGRSAGALWTSETAADEWDRITRGIRRRGEAYRISVQRAARLLDDAGLSSDAAYSREIFDAAARHANDRVVVGNRGYDLTVTLPKSYSVLAAVTDAATAQELEDILLTAGNDTLAYAETIAGYGMRGHHGDGKTARRVAGQGLIGWANVHRTARPTAAGMPGDPHLHIHYTIANLVQGADGQWSTIAAGGRDLMVHAASLGEFMSARARRLTQQKLGLHWARDPLTGQWEIAGIDREAITLWSKRGMQVNKLLAELGLTPDTATTAQHRVASQASRSRKDPAIANATDATLRDHWHTEARAAAIDPDRLAAAADAARGPIPARPSDDELAAVLYDTATGITSRNADFCRRDMLAAVADALPDGVADTTDLARITNRMLARAEAVPMPPRSGEVLTNNDRYTTQDLVDASNRVVEATNAGIHAEHAVVSPSVAAWAEDLHEITHGYALSDEQRAVYRRLVHDGHQIDTVIGVAGAGKTTIVAAARTAWEAHGLTVRGATVAAVAADNLREAGVPSTTIASLLHPSQALTDALAGVDVLVIDEAGQVGVRHLDLLLAAAKETGTKVVEIGDPKQLGSPVPGGALAAQHRATAGLTLTENRRQRDPVAQHAAALWRRRKFHAALTSWRDAGHIVSTGTRAEALRAALDSWSVNRIQYLDRYDRLDEVLLLATRNADIADLNVAARTLARQNGDLVGNDHAYPLAAGGTRPFAVGDVVMTRANDYRTWRDDGPDILNGRRGYIDAIDPHTGAVTIAWRSKGEIHQATVTADYIAKGGLDHGYAMTIYKAQGQTADHAHTYGVDINAHTTYVAQTRTRNAATLYLPLDALVDPDEFTPHDIAKMEEATRTDLAISLIAEQAELTREERLVTEELADAATAARSSPLAEQQPASGTRRPSRKYLAGLHPDLQRRLRGDPALPALLDRLNRVAEQGHDPAEVLRRITGQREVDTAFSTARTLHKRLGDWLDGNAGLPAQRTSQSEPPGPNDDVVARLRATRARVAHDTSTDAVGAVDLQISTAQRGPDAPDHDLDLENERMIDVDVEAAPDA